MKLFSKFTPALRIIIWFAIPILVGALLLALPVSSEGVTVRFIDALFTATSAFCVTGLAVVNIPNTYSYFGEGVIMLLMQLGGLGVMTLSTLFFLALGGRISSTQILNLRETLTSKTDDRIRSVLKAAFLVTFIVEGIGAAFLFFPFATRLPPLQAAYFAVFHSVSAFNNAGLSIIENGMVEYHTNIALALGVAFLIIIGGIGFSVNREIIGKLTHRSTRKRMSLHSKLTLMTTGILIVGGTACFLVLEMNNAYGQDPWHLKVVDSFFQSVTPRTAGFDTVPQNKLSVFSLLITILLMLIGASPGSTGGGIKTTSFAIIVAAIVSRIKGVSGVNIFKRTVSADSIIKAISIFILAVLLIFVATMALMLFESGFSPSAVSRGAELGYLFETVSAFGTVGLSLGMTPFLHTPGKLILIVMMVIGRVGLLTMFYVVAKPEGAGRITYSEESVMVG